MRIVMATEFIPPAGKGFSGGAEARTFYMARELKRRGHDVALVSSYLTGTMRREEFDGVPVLRVGPMRDYTQRGQFLARRVYMKGIAGACAEVKPEIVDGSGFVSWDGSYRAARECGARAVMTVHEVWKGQWIRNMGPVNGAIGAVLEGRCFRRPYDRYVAVSKFTSERMTSSFGISPDRIDVVHNGVRLEDFNAVKVPGRYDDPTICTVCRLVPYKRVQDILDAMAILKRDHPKLRLKVVGAGSYMDALKKKADALGIAGRVEFLGRVGSSRDLVAIMKRSHVFVLASVVEGFGMVILEAMACETPYVATDIPPIREVTEGGTGGALFAPENAKDLAEKINMMLDSKTNGRKLVEEKYTWGPLARHLERSYRRALA